MNKLAALWNLFRKGEQVANPEAWKQAQIITPLLAGLLVALATLAKAFGYELPIDDDTAALIAGGIAAAVNVVGTIITSRKVGLLPAKPVVCVPEPDSAAGISTRPAPLPPITDAPRPPAQDQTGNAGIDDESRRRAMAFLQRNRGS